MQTLNELEAAPIPVEEEEHRHARRLFIGVLLALFVTSSLLAGYLYLRKRHEAQVGPLIDRASAVPLVTPKVEVFVDDAMLKDHETLLGGTVHNISTETLHAVNVELELRRRTGGSLDVKAIPLNPPDLPPDAKGHYSFSAPARDYSSARLLRLVAGDNHEELPFKAFAGVPRPPEAPPAAKTIITKRPASRGGDFLNTPNNPVRIP